MFFANVGWVVHSVLARYLLDTNKDFIKYVNTLHATMCSVFIAEMTISLNSKSFAYIPV